MRFNGHRDLLAGLADGEGLWVAARRESEFREFRRLLEPTGMSWEAGSDDWPRDG
ncbi:hypothetical protein [Paludisphaera soli]|uniref:hypothetical protein n=1 Tax=Paludisphaera soli TaxID=2712865 RepID=UPI0013E9ED2F|nr:hypothetical protein [Paludisphaera soli]